MGKAVFFDTNVLVYAYDNRDPIKQQTARTLLEARAVDENGRISTQVIQELCNVGIGKLNLPLDALVIIIDELLVPLLAHVPDAEFYKRAVQLQQKHGFHFYDALIVQAAIDLNCTTLYSEDLQDGQKFGGLTIKNPFK